MSDQDEITGKVLQRMASKNPFKQSLKYVFKNLHLIDHHTLRDVTTVTDIAIVESAFARWSKFPKSMAYAELSGIWDDVEPDPLWKITPNPMRDIVIVVSAIMDGDTSVVKGLPSRSKQDALHALPRTLNIYRGIRESLDVIGVTKNFTDHHAARFAIEAAHVYELDQDAINVVVASLSMAERLSTGDSAQVREIAATVSPEWMRSRISAMHRTWYAHTS